MSYKGSFCAPLRFVFEHSKLIAPAREFLEEADHWTDFAMAALYVAILFAVIYGLAVSLHTEFLLAVGGLAVAVVLINKAWDYYSK